MTATVHTFPGSDGVPLEALSFEQAAHHVALLTGSADTPVCLRLIHDRDRAADAIKLEGSIRELWSVIETRQAQGFGVFVVVNEGGHRASDITRIRAAFVDADGVPPPAKWHVQPDFMVQRDETHWHAYWSITGLPVEGFRDTQQRLAARYGTDRAVCDRSRVMRLAGTLHLKDAADPYSVILDQRCADPTRVGLNAADLIADLPEIERTAPASPAAVSGLPITPQEIEARLACCDPDCPYPDWRDLAGSLHAMPCTDPEFSTRSAFVAWSRAGSKYECDQDCEDVFDTMPPKPGGLGAGSFIRITNAAGYRGPTVGKNDQSAAEAFGEIVAGLALAEDPTESPARAVRVILRDEATQDARPPIQWLVEGLLPDGGTVAIRAPFNSYKSFIATDLALAVASGHRAFNRLHVRRAGPVVNMLGEGAAGFETQRRPAWRKVRGIDASVRLPIYTIEGVPQVRSDEDVAAYVEAVRTLPERPALIIIDTAARAMAGLNENEAGDAGRFLNMVELLARTFRCCVLTIMHEGKDGSRGARGSSAFEAGFENVWKIEADTDALTAKLIPVKLKDDGGADALYLQGQEVSVAGRKPSLVFERVEGEPPSAGRPAKFGRRDIGAALRRLEAVGGQTASTSVLAVEVAGPDADDKLLDATERTLQRGAKGRFASYVAHLGEGRRDPTLWSVPTLENEGERS